MENYTIRKWMSFKAAVEGCKPMKTITRDFKTFAAAKAFAKRHANRDGYPRDVVQTGTVAPCAWRSAS